MKKVTSILLVLVMVSALSISAFAASDTEVINYDEIIIGMSITRDEYGNEVIKEISLADCEFFDAEGNPVEVSEAVDVETTITRSSVTHKPNVVLASGYMMRYGDYYCTTVNSVTLSCTLGSAAKVAFGYSYAANPTDGAEVYTANTDKTSHDKTFSVPSDNYYKFYVANISPGNVTLKTFTISY